MVSSLMTSAKVEKLICSSGGNAGHAVATVGRAVSLPVDVYVPVTTKVMMVEKIRKTGANVIIGGENWNAADREARKAVSEQHGSYYIPPYDDPLIWEGNSSLIDELADANMKPGAIVLSVGGGGLLCGVQSGLERHGWSDVKVFAVETEGAASFAAAHAAGEPIPITAIDSIATSLGALAVTAATLRTTIHTTPIQVSDREAVQACLRFADEQRMLVEPACGASLATIYGEEKLRAIQDSLGDNKNIVVIVCGGSIVSLELLEFWKKQFNI